VGEGVKVGNGASVGVKVGVENLYSRSPIHKR